MEKKNSLPNLQLGVLTEKTKTVSDVLNVDLTRLNEKITNYFERNVSVSEIYDEKTAEFNDDMNSTSLQAFMEMYNHFTDAEIRYALWKYIDTSIRLLSIIKK